MHIEVKREKPIDMNGVSVSKHNSNERHSLTRASEWASIFIIDDRDLLTDLDISRCVLHLMIH